MVEHVPSQNEEMDKAYSWLGRAARLARKFGMTGHTVESRGLTEVAPGQYAIIGNQDNRQAVQIDIDEDGSAALSLEEYEELKPAIEKFKDSLKTDVNGTLTKEGVEAFAQETESLSDKQEAFLDYVAGYPGAKLH